jgi:hypothetical protein
VLFLRRWRNGDIDSDCAISERDADGSWIEPSSSGGGGWIEYSLARPDAGWDGDPVLWIGSSGFGTFEPDDEDLENAPVEEPVERKRGTGFGHSQPLIIRAPPGLSAEDESAFMESEVQRMYAERQAEWDQLDVRVVRGAASAQVAAIGVEQDGRRWTVPIESACGAFLVGLERPGPVMFRALDRDGEPLPDADGVTEHRAR